MAARRAAAINPMNAPARLIGRPLEPDELAALTTRYWGATGVRLTVSFLDNPPKSLQERVLEHMNAWSKKANVSFRRTAGHGEVRIARAQNGGHWSYLGTDILSVPLHRPTLNLDSFTTNTPESEFTRVVRHVTGHTLGFPHEHLRRSLVEKIDRKKAFRYFARTQGWGVRAVCYQVITPIEEGSLISDGHADPRSIMCYQIPGSITKNGEPILGGTDIVASDHALVGRLYPKP
jgi:hypothetical protein